MYADGSLVSTGFRAGNDRVGNYTNSPIRRTSVVKQLVLRGSILTENTIGGAIKGTSGYKYPASSKEGDNPPDSDTEAAFSAALTYDLNFFRESNDGWDQAPNNTLNEGNKTNFVIIYNPSVIKSPPKGFKIR